MQHKWVLVAGVALAWHSTAHAAAPAWCKGTGTFDAGSYARASDDADRVADLLKNCQPDGAGAFDKAREAESKRLYMSEDDWNDAAAWLAGDGYSESHPSAKVVATTFASLSPVDQYVLISKGVRDAYSGADALYLTDALEQNLTEAGRLAFLESCELDKQQPAMWALCLPDAAKLDGSKLATELRADTSHSAKDRFAVRLRFGLMLDKLAHFKTAGPELIKKDDAYKKLFDAAAQGHLDWDNTLGTKKDLLALAQQLDSAWYFHSKKQYADCEDRSEKALADAVSKVPAKTFEGMRDDPADMKTGFFSEALPKLLTFPEVSLAANAFAMCEPNRGWSRAIGMTLRYMAGYRGPRSASYSAISSQKFELDDTRAGAIAVPAPGQRPYGIPSSGIFSSGGVVQSLKPGKDKDQDVVIVSQPKTSITTEDCLSWRETKKQIGWDTMGRPTYESFCEKTAMVKHDTSPNDWPVLPQGAKMLKVGMRFSVVTGGGQRDVVAVWPSKTAKLPSMVLGGTVK